MCFEPWSFQGNSGRTVTAVPSTHWVWDPRFDDRQRQREGKKFGVWQRRRRSDIGIPAFYSLHRFSVYRQPYFPDSVNNFLLQRRGWETRLGPDCCFVSNSCCQDSDFSVFVNSTFLIMLHTVFLLFCKKKCFLRGRNWGWFLSPSVGRSCGKPALPGDTSNCLPPRGVTL